MLTLPTGQDEQPAQENSSKHNNSEPGRRERTYRAQISPGKIRSLSSMSVRYRNSSGPVLVNAGPGALHPPGLPLLKMASETDPLPDGLKTERKREPFKHSPRTDAETTPQIRSETLRVVVCWSGVFGLWGSDHVVVVVVAVIFLSALL